MNKSITLLLMVVVGLGLNQISLGQFPNTAFTYQGRLSDGGSPAEGAYDFKFKLFDEPNLAGVQIGPAVTKENINVYTGYFTVELDFGKQFLGEDRWLEIGVRPGIYADPNVYTTLIPRQPLNPTPYAQYAQLAGADSDWIVKGNYVYSIPMAHIGIGTTTPGEFLTVAGRIESTSGGFKFPDGSIQTSTATGSEVKQLVHNFVVAAGESVTTGDVVSFLDGYIQSGYSPDDISFGSEEEFNLAENSPLRVVALSDNKFVVAYRDEGNSDYGTCVVGKISGSTITFGSEYVFNSAYTSSLSVVALSSDKFLMSYSDGGNSSYGTCIIGEVSTTTITYGSEYVFNPGYTSSISLAVLTSNKFMVAYKDNDNSNYGTAIIGGISGTTITYGSEYVFNSASSSETSAAALSSTKIVVAYADGDNLNYGTAVVGVVSGTVLAFGGEYVFNSYDMDGGLDIAAVSTNKFVAVYEDWGNSFYGTAVIGEITGTNITYGHEFVFNSSKSSYVSVALLSPNKIVLVYKDENNSDNGIAVIGSVSGTNVTFGSDYPFNTTMTFHKIPVVGLSSTQFVVAYEDGDNSNYGTAVIGDVTFDKVVGIAQQSKAAGETVSVIIGGISNLHSGLISGEVYFSNEWGGLITDDTDYRIGLAISGTEILLNSNRTNADQFFGDMVFANNFRITEADAYAGLILKNHQGQEILTVDEGGIVEINGLSLNNPSTQYANWLMFEDQNGVGLRNLKTGRVYDIVLRERNIIKPDSSMNLEKAIQDLQAEVKALKVKFQNKK